MKKNIIKITNAVLGLLLASPGVYAIDPSVDLIHQRTVQLVLAARQDPQLKKSLEEIAKLPVAKRIAIGMMIGSRLANAATEQNYCPAFPEALKVSFPDNKKQEIFDALLVQLEKTNSEILK